MDHTSIHAVIPQAEFVDSDDFADSLYGLDGKFVPTGSSDLPWWTCRRRVGGIKLQLAQVGGPAIFAGAANPDTIAFGVPVGGTPLIRIDGSPAKAGGYVLLQRSRTFTYAARSSTQWVGVVIPTHHPCLDGQAHRNLATQAERHGALAHTDPTLLRLLANTTVRACHRRAWPATDERRAEEEIVDLASMLLQYRHESARRNAGRLHVSRSRVIAKALQIMQEHIGKPVTVSDLCREIEIGERTLRNIFYDYFCVGPMRLLHVWRMTAIRARLGSCDPAHETVTHVATEFGIWDLSLFACQYRALFGETPSATLHKPRKPRVNSELSWMSCAARTFVLRAALDA